MLQERQIINLILQGKLSSGDDIHLRLAELGFVNAKGQPFNKAQIQSLQHSARTELKRRNYRYVESCGIDRSKNPCGDASDY